MVELRLQVVPCRRTSYVIWVLQVGLRTKAIQGKPFLGMQVPQPQIHIGSRLLILRHSPNPSGHLKIPTAMKNQRLKKEN